MIASAALVLALASPLQDPAPGTIQGIVLAETGERVVAASISVTGPGARALMTRTDDRGRYRLRDVPAGERVLRVVAAGYATLEVSVQVPSGDELELDLTLELQPLAGPPIAVTVDPRAPPADTLPEPEIRLAGPATTRTVAAAPGLVEVGLAGAGGGSREPVDPTDVLYVRGAAADLKRVLLDGAPVYAPFHVAGLLPPFAPATLGTGILYLGGAPARYDGGLAYVLDLRTRAPRRSGSPRASGALDLVSARAAVDVRLGEHAGAWASGRATHPFGIAAMREDAMPYAYADALGRIDVELDDDDRLHATLFWNDERVRLDPAAPSAEAASWGNTAGALRYVGQLGGTGAEVTAAFGRFAAHVPTGAPDFVGDAVAAQARLAADFHTDHGGLRWRYGASFERLEVRSGAAAGPSTDSPAGFDVAGGVGGVHVEAGWQPSAAVSVRAGTRMDAYSGSGRPRFGPRLALTWLVTDEIALTLAGGRYHQLLPVMLVDSDREVIGHELGPAGATHLVTRLEQTPLDGVDFGVEGYYKRFHGVPRSASWSDAYASGLDFWLRVERDRWTGWTGYSLEWTWALAGDVVTDRFAGRHLLSAGLEGPIGGGGRFDLRLGYGAGLPYTSLLDASYDGVGVVETASAGDTEVPSLEFERTAEGAPWVAPISESFFRVDAEASWDWTVGWGGGETLLTPYVKVLNAFGDRDGVFFRRDVGAGEPQPVDTAPILPILGLRWRF